MSGDAGKKRKHRASEEDVARRGLLPGQTGKSITPESPPALNFLIAGLGLPFVDSKKTVGQPSVNQAFLVALWLTREASPEARQVAAKLMALRGSSFVAEVARIQKSDTFQAFVNASEKKPFSLRDAADPLRAILSLIHLVYGRYGAPWTFTAEQIAEWLRGAFPESFHDVETERVRRACREVGLKVAPGKRGPHRGPRDGSPTRPKIQTLSGKAFNLEELSTINNASLLSRGRRKKGLKNKQPDAPL